MIRLGGTFGGTFPFAPHYLDVGPGRMHYVDEGTGAPVLLLHGNPTWSYLYRRFIRPLSATHRAVAPDLLGFGRSDKPADGDFTLAGHIQNLTAFVLKLDLRDLTLVLHDWGGPIGLGFAVEHPERIRRLVVLNTWAFRLPAAARLHPLLEAIRTPGRGEALVLQQNVLVERGLPAGIHHGARVTRRLLEAYRAPFLDPATRHAMLALVREIPVGATGAVGCMARIEQRLRLLEVDTLIAWGCRDPVFPPEVLSGWKRQFPRARVELLPEASHFLQEDEPRRLIGLLRRFLAGS